MVRFGILYALLLGASAFAAIHAEPPSFIVDAHGNPWAVQYSKWIGEDEAGHPFVGMTVEPEHRIQLLVGRSLQQTQESLLHELMHVVMGVDHSYDKIVVHDCIYQLAEGLEAIFVENPDLVRYFEAR